MSSGRRFGPATAICRAFLATRSLTTRWRSVPWTESILHQYKSKEAMDKAAIMLFEREELPAADAGRPGALSVSDS